ncbi:ammonium transporter [Roseiconus nitratireducens]|nr:ammonium transporter [Roseiconus nitratireducens]
MLDNPLDLTWVLVASALVMLMQAGFCLLESGLVRSKNSINVAMKNIADFCVSAAAFWLLGFGLMFGTSHSGLYGTDHFFCDSEATTKTLAFLVFQSVFCSTAATIVSGAVAERMRFVSYLTLTALIAGLLYPLFGHWAWGGALVGNQPGYLAARGFIDFAGSTVVHSLGGWAALAAVIVLGPRLGRFGTKHRPIHGHSLPMAAVGTLVLWFGWFGFNGGSTLVVSDALPSILLNTNLGAVFGGLAAMCVSSCVERRPVVDHSLNGIIAGLVSVTAGCHLFSPAASALCGAVGGAVCTASTYAMVRMRIDDAIGAVPAHAAAGSWGTVAVALLSAPSQWTTGLSRWQQLGIQIEGIATCFAWAFTGSALVCFALARLGLLRVSKRAEILGLNIAEHQATTELSDLNKEMNLHRRSGVFHRRVSPQRFVELGAIARQYNRVLQRVTVEITKHTKTADRLAEAEARFRSMFENAREGIFQLSPQGRVLLVNRSFAEITGYESPQQVASQVDDAAVDVFEDPRAWQTFTHLLQTNGKVAGFEAEFRRADQKHIWVSINARRVDSASDPYFEGSIVDITDRRNNEILQVEKRRLARLNERLSIEIKERREAELKSRQNEQKFRALFESTRDAILILRNDSIVDCNRAAGRLFKLTNRSSFLGRSLVDLSPPKQPSGASSSGLLKQYAAQAIRKGSQAFDWECQKSDDGTFPCEVVLSVAEIEGETMIQATIHDLTDRQRYVQELTFAKDQAQLANRSKSEFLANISHEIRTPLNGILGFAEVLRRGAGEPGREQEYLDTIHSSGQHLLTLINDILDLTKIEAGRMEIEQTVCSPHAIICEVISILRVIALEKGLSLESVWETEVPETITTDPARLRQLIMNLVGNAIKFTEQGCVKVRASVKLCGEESRFIIEVSDTGIGIDPSNLERIFSPFDQADNSITRRFGGTGLGLAISRAIAQELGGDIQVTSVPDVGSTFRIEVAAGSLKGVAMLSCEQAEAVRSNSLSRRQNLGESRASLEGASILVCDDGETNRQLIGLVLSEDGARVTSCSHGKEAVELLRDTPTEFDLVLMDMQMPVMDGYTATAMLRKEGWDRPVIALTAHAMRGDEEKCINAGCTAYLRKPIDIDELLDSVAAQLSTVSRPKTTRSPGESNSGPESISATASHLPADGIRSTLPMDRPEFRRIVTRFHEKLSDRVIDMRQSIQQGDHGELAAQAHWLKGSGGTMGFGCLTESAERLESFAKAEDGRGALKALEEIEGLLRRMDVPDPDDDLPA